MKFEGDNWEPDAGAGLLSQVELHGRADWRPDISTLLSPEFSAGFASGLDELIFGALAIGTPPTFRDTVRYLAFVVSDS